MNKGEGDICLANVEIWVNLKVTWKWSIYDYSVTCFCICDLEKIGFVIIADMWLSYDERAQ